MCISFLLLCLWENLPALLKKHHGENLKPQKWIIINRGNVKHTTYLLHILDWICSSQMLILSSVDPAKISKI